MSSLRRGVGYLENLCGTRVPVFLFRCQKVNYDQPLCPEIRLGVSIVTLRRDPEFLDRDFLPTGCYNFPHPPLP